MSDILNDVVLGSTVDELGDDEYDQNELNEDLLNNHDKKTLINNIGKRMSKPYIMNLIESLDKTDIKYFDILLNEISREYSLNFCKLFEDKLFDIGNYVDEILKFIIYLKIKLILDIEDFTILNSTRLNKTTTREEFEIYLNKDNAPELIKLCIKFIDGESYKKFIDKIFLEAMEDYIE
jgi:hypothetical protein